MTGKIRRFLLLLIGLTLALSLGFDIQGPTRASGPEALESGIGPGVAEHMPLFLMDADNANAGNGSPAPAGGAAGATASAAPAAPGQPTVAPRHLALPGGGHAAYIRIDGAIDRFTALSIRRRVDRAMRSTPTPTVIIIELNTPGGELDAALEISRFLKQDVTVPTIAWVNSQALSAGTMIGVACNHLVMSPASTMGDSAPIAIDAMGQVSATVMAKVLSPILAEYRDSADRRGYPFVLFHAMCVLSVEVFLIERTTSSGTEQLLVNEADYLVMVEGLSIAEANDRMVRKFTERFGDPGFPGRPTVSVARDDSNESDRGQWALVRQVHDGNTLLTLTQSEAEDLGLAVSGAIRTVEEMQALLNAGPEDYIRVNQTWSESLAEFLSRFYVRAILLGLFIIFAFIELQTPGLGIAGLFAMTALAGLIGGPLILGLAEVWHIVLFGLGLVLVVIEIFVMPGVAVAGIMGVICIVVGLVLMMVPTAGGGPMPLPASGTSGTLLASVLSIIVGLGVGIAGLFLASRFYDEIPLLRKMVLKGPPPIDPNFVPGSEGTTPPATSSNTDASEAAQTTSTDEAAAPLGAKVGDEGVVVSTLHPAGRARFGRKTVDVICDGGWIDTGKKVRIVEIAGNRVLVVKA
ncbi:MAG: hypothetical protein JJU36_13375 [Phycisphaeraceae bacterium]|nr:hypothetical protein [Phycisphaeraceae bacterium]